MNPPRLPVDPRITKRIPKATLQVLKKTVLSYKDHPASRQQADWVHGRCKNNSCAAHVRKAMSTGTCDTRYTCCWSAARHVNGVGEASGYLYIHIDIYIYITPCWLPLGCSWPLLGNPLGSLWLPLGCLLKPLWPS